MAYHLFHNPLIKKGGLCKGSDFKSKTEKGFSCDDSAA